MNQSFKVGDRVRLATAPPYFKTAEPMPMLRPPDLIPPGSLGLLREQRLAGTWVVEFEPGTFLIDDTYLEVCPPGAA